MTQKRTSAILVSVALALSALVGLYWLGPGQDALRLLGFDVGGPSIAERLAAYADARTLDWSDLIPANQSDAAMRLRSGDLARGIVQHGDLGPITAPIPGESKLPGGTDTAKLTPAELAQLMGAYSNLASPARRAADSFGIGNMKALQPPGLSIREDLDGVNVRIAGFIAPLSFDGTRVSEFLLVPYVGACIHVPPPPSNQILDVADFQGYQPEGLLYPVWVTGRLRAVPLETDLASVGYRIEDAVVELYQG